MHAKGFGCISISSKDIALNKSDPNSNRGFPLNSSTPDDACCPCLWHGHQASSEVDELRGNPRLELGSDLFSAISFELIKIQPNALA